MDVDLELAAQRYAVAKEQADDAKATLRAAVVQMKAEKGTPDAELARLAGVDRMTVLAWLGKRTRWSAE